MKKFYPLSHAQKVIWNVENYFPNTSINNIAATLQFKEEMDYKILELAINLLVKKTMHLKSE